MKSITESIYERGKHGTKYLRVRIPKSVRPAYPQRCTHITLSLGTTDLKEAKVLARSHRARLDAEFERVPQCLVDRQSALYTRQSIESKATVRRLEGDSFSHIQAMTNQALAGGASSVGLDLGSRSVETQSKLDAYVKELGVDRVLSCLESYSAFQRTSKAGSQEGPQALPVAALSLPAGLDPQAQVPAEASNGPLEPRKLSGEGKAPPGWDEVFAVWRDFVPDRPRSTAIAAQTPWRDLQRFKVTRDPGRECKSPAEVTAEDMSR